MARCMEELCSPLQARALEQTPPWWRWWSAVMHVWWRAWATQRSNVEWSTQVHRWQSLIKEHTKVRFQFLSVHDLHRAHSWDASLHTDTSFFMCVHDVYVKLTMNHLLSAHCLCFCIWCSQFGGYCPLFVRLWPRLCLRFQAADNHRGWLCQVGVDHTFFRSWHWLWYQTDSKWHEQRNNGGGVRFPRPKHSQWWVTLVSLSNLGKLVCMVWSKEVRVVWSALLLLCSTCHSLVEVAVAVVVVYWQHLSKYPPMNQQMKDTG